jgi:hypothetical protein
VTGEAHSRSLRCAPALVLVATLFCVPAGGQEAPRRIDLSAAVEGALELAESIRDSPTKVALLIDIAALQAKGSDEPAARATLTQGLRAAGAVQDTGKRCELLMRMSEPMLGAGAPDAAAWILQEVESRIVSRQVGRSRGRRRGGL